MSDKRNREEAERLIRLAMDSIKEAMALISGSGQQTPLPSQSSPPLRQPLFQKPTPSANSRGVHTALAELRTPSPAESSSGQLPLSVRAMDRIRALSLASGATAPETPPRLQRAPSNNTTEAIGVDSPLGEPTTPNPSARSSPSGRMRVLSTPYGDIARRAREKWTAEQTDRMFELLGEGRSHEEIGSIIGKTLSQIQSKLSNLSRRR